MEKKKEKTLGLEVRENIIAGGRVEVAGIVLLLGQSTVVLSLAAAEQLSTKLRRLSL